MDYYIGLIPKDPILIDSINQRRNDAYFRLGSIYKDQFDEYQISNEKLFGLLENKPSENLIPPSKYFIYKNFLSLDSVIKAEEYKQDIIVNDGIITSSPSERSISWKARSRATLPLETAIACSLSNFSAHDFSNFSTIGLVPEIWFLYKVFTTEYLSLKDYSTLTIFGTFSKNHAVVPKQADSLKSSTVYESSMSLAS